MKHTTNTACLEAYRRTGIPIGISTLLAAEARGALPIFERDANGRRLISENDLEAICDYLVKREAVQGPLVAEKPSTDPEDDAERPA